MKRDMRDPRVDIVFDGPNGRRLPDEEQYIRLWGWTGARPDIMESRLTEDTALILARELLTAVTRRRSWK